MSPEPFYKRLLQRILGSPFALAEFVVRFLNLLLDGAEKLGVNLLGFAHEILALISTTLRWPLHFIKAAEGFFAALVNEANGLGTAVSQRMESIGGVIAGITSEVFHLVANTAFAPVIRLLMTLAEPLVVIVEVLFAIAVQVFERCEWIFGAIAAAVFEVGTFIAKILYGILCHVVDRILQIILPSPIGWLARWIIRQSIPARLLDSLERFASIDECVRVLAAPYVDFGRQWYASRDFNKLAFATPAILMSGALLLPIVLSLADSPHDKTLRYRRALAKAIDEEDGDRVKVMLARLEQLGDRKHENDVYQVAYADAEREGPEFAYYRMLNLAEGEDGGLRAAKLWIARHIISGDLEQDNEHALEFAGRLIDEAVASRGADDYTRRLQVELTFQRDGVDAGIASMEQYSLRQEWAQARLMRLYALKKNWSRARKMAIKVADAYNRRVKHQHEHTLARHMLHIEALLLLEDTDALKVAVDEIESRYGEKPLETFVAGAVLDRGMKFDSELAMTLHRLWPHATQLSDFLGKQLGDGNAKVSEFVSTRDADGFVDSRTYRVAGDQCYANGNPERALHFYQQATRVNAADADAWNNVAWIEYERGNLAVALDAATRAVTIRPMSNFLETRGQIFAKLKRWPESIRDLERALNGQLATSQTADTHRTLASAYDALGAVELAAVHRQRSVTDGPTYW